MFTPNELSRLPVQSVERDRCLQMAHIIMQVARKGEMRHLSAVPTPRLTKEGAWTAAWRDTVLMLTSSGQAELVRWIPSIAICVFSQNETTLGNTKKEMAVMNSTELRIHYERRKQLFCISSGDQTSHRMHKACAPLSPTD